MLYKMLMTIGSSIALSSPSLYGSSEQSARPQHAPAAPITALACRVLEWATPEPRGTRTCTTPVCACTHATCGSTYSIHEAGATSHAYRHARPGAYWWRRPSVPCISSADTVYIEDVFAGSLLASTGQQCGRRPVERWETEAEVNTTWLFG